MPSCEKSILDDLKGIVADHKRIDGLILDISMPLEMGKIIHKVFNNTSSYDALLEDSHLVFSPVPSEERWRSVLVDRFRTEMALLDPAHRAIFLLSDKSQQYEWSLFVSHGPDFFSRLSEGLSSIVERSGFETYSVLEVENGMKNLVAAFVPTSKIVHDSDYDKTEAAKQWMSQRPMGHQSIIQMNMAASMAPLKRNERVLAEVDPDGSPWPKEFQVGTVLGKGSVEGTYFVQGEADESFDLLRREYIRKFSPFDSDTSKRFEVGDVILFQDEQSVYRNGVISARTGENEYSIYLLDFFRTQHHKVPGSRLMLQWESAAESTEETEPQLSLSDLIEALEGALFESGIVHNNKGTYLSKTTNVGSGAIECAFWRGGNAIMKWNGSGGVEISLFTDGENKIARNKFQKLFKDKLQWLHVVTFDDFPRGYGNVVNFMSEIKVPPKWLKSYV